MIVAYRGNRRAAWCTETHVMLSLEAMGHQVLFLQEDTTTWDQCLDAARKAHFFMWTRTWGTDPEGAHRVLAQMATDGIPTVSFHLDRYIGLDREAQIQQHDPFWESAYVFTADGGNQDKFAAYGVNHHWLPPGVFGPECTIGTPNRKFPHKVVFVGSYPYPHAEWHPYRQAVVEGARARYGTDFAVWPKPRQPIRGKELSDLYASCQVVIGDSCLSGDPPPTHYWSDRISETLGRGGALVHPYVIGLDDWYEPGVDLLTYPQGDFDGLFAKVDWLLEHPDERKAMALHGQQTVLGRDTYAHRMQSVIDIVSAGGVHQPEVANERHNARHRNSRPVSFEVRPGHPTDKQVIDEVWRDDQYGITPQMVAGKTVVDIGGNIGAFSVLAATLKAKAVHVWEPEPSNLAVLRSNVAAYPNITVHEAALMPFAGHIGIAPGPDGVQGGGSHVSDDGEALSFAVGEEVNEALRALGPIGFCKLDAESAEYPIVAALADDVLNQIERIHGEWHGPLMPHLADQWPASGVGDFMTQWGLFVVKLADYGRLSLFGHPRAGGTFTWTRF